MDGTGDHYPKSAKNIVVATTFHQDGVKQKFKQPLAKLYYIRNIRVFPLKKIKWQ